LSECRWWNHLYQLHDTMKARMAESDPMIHSKGISAMGYSESNKSLVSSLLLLPITRIGFTNYYRWSHNEQSNIYCQDKMSDHYHIWAHSEGGQGGLIVYPLCTIRRAIWKDKKRHSHQVKTLVK
jgi:hypothetical protein